MALERFSHLLRPMESGPHPVVVPSIVLETDDGRRVTVERFPWLIGSSPFADLRLEHRSVSSNHALLVWSHDSGKARIIDLKSTNGTFLNGRRVRSASLLAGGRLAFGSVVVTCRFLRLTALACAQSK